MTKIIVLQNITLDGVMQGPGRADEDARGGFTHGGWADGYQDDVSMRFAGEGMSRTGALLFGHRTYDDLLEHWTTTPEPNPFAEVLLRTPKYVTSHSAGTQLSYPNSTLLVGDAVDRVATVKSEVHGDLMIMGSGELIRSLHDAGLIDEYILQIYPIVLGSGTKLFAEGNRINLILTRSITTTTGVIIAQYTTH
jgi:dihydrofolate reductase